MSSTNFGSILISASCVLWVLVIYYKVPLREVPKGVAHERKPKHPTSDGLWANKLYLVAVKIMFLSAAREAECGEAPSRVRVALSPSWWRTVNKW